MVSFAPRRKASFSFPNQNSSTLPRFRAISIEQKDSSPSLFHHSSTMDAHAERFTTDEIASAAFLFHFSFSCTRVKKRCSLIRPSSFFPILFSISIRLHYREFIKHDSRNDGRWFSILKVSRRNSSLSVSVIGNLLNTVQRRVDLRVA